MDPLRYERRRRREPRSRRRLIIVFVVVFFLIIVGSFSYAVLFSPLFKIQNIVIEERIEDSMFQSPFPPSLGLADSAVKDKLLTGLKNHINDLDFTFLPHSLFGDDHLFGWPSGDFLAGNTAGDLNAFFDAEPHYKAITIEKKYFARGLKIEVAFRRPIGVWCTSRMNADETLIQQGNSSSSKPEGSSSGPSSSAPRQHESECRWFDSRGTPFAAAPDVAGNLILNVRDLSGQNIDTEHPVLEDRLMKNFISVAKILEEVDLPIRSFVLRNAELQEIETDPSLLFLPVFRFSVRDDPEFIRKGIAELHKIGLHKIADVDFRVPNRMYYRLR